VVAVFVFVGCSYSPWPIGGYRDAFREVMKIQKDVIFEFADVRIENTWILEKVTKHIERSDMGLFDITFLNPNVLLELGIALGMRKRSHIFFECRSR
jgi:nucleoside 2-deoxyribosyltransferase